MILQIDVRVAEQAAAARQQDHHDYGPLAPLFGLAKFRWFSRAIQLFGPKAGWSS